VPLTQPIVPGGVYELSFSIRHAQNSRFAIDQIGMALHDGARVAGDSIYAGRLQLQAQLSTPPDFIIDFQVSWTTFFVSFTAEFPATHLTFGRFVKPSDLSITEVISDPLPSTLRRAIYYIDDVSVEVISLPLNIEEEQKNDPFRVFIGDGGQLQVYSATNSRIQLFTLNGSLLSEFEISAGLSKYALPSDFKGLLLVKHPEFGAKKILVP
jgi:hypothetical protein